MANQHGASEKAHRRKAKPKKAARSGGKGISGKAAQIHQNIYANEFCCSNEVGDMPRRLKA